MGTDLMLEFLFRPFLAHAWRRFLQCAHRLASRKHAKAFYISDNIPASLLTGSPTCFPTVVPTGIPTSIPTGILNGIPFGISTGIIDIPTGMATGMATGIATGILTAF